MNNARRATLTWSLGAVIFSLIGIYVALGSGGAWYSVISAVILLAAGLTFAVRAILSLRASDPNI